MNEAIEHATPCSDSNMNAHTVNVVVNFKTVTLTERRVTGLAIKEAAIAQGVAIELDFVLFIHLGPRKRKVIGDSDPITVRPGQKFEAIPHDDNS